MHRLSQTTTRAAGARWAGPALWVGLAWLSPGPEDWHRSGVLITALEDRT